MPRLSHGATATYSTYTIGSPVWRLFRSAMSRSMSACSSPSHSSAYPSYRPTPFAWFASAS